MPDARRAPRAPWIIAAVAGVAFIALLVVYFVPLANARDGATTGQLTAEEQRAMNAAGTETANITTLSRAHFERDYARAIAGSEGALKSDIEGKKATTLKLLQQNKFDLTAKVTHEALVGPSAKGHGYVVLVTINGYKSTAPNTPIQSNLEVTVVDSGGKFLASNVQNIAVS